jgi:tRNA pseudouridine38-40 synthase
MTRYKATVEYDGRDFVGWQRQDNGYSVQQAVEQAITGFCGETVVVYAAGRTDAGVHALGQVIHFDLVQDAAPDTVRDAVNQHLRPDPVALLDVVIADPDFDARFSARRRAYRYRIVNRRTPLVLDRGRAWGVPVALDAAAMQAAADHLVGRHDFTTFRSVRCQAKSPEKTLDALVVARTGDEITVTARARSFLHRQVRIMVGTLKQVGDGKWRPDDVAQALAARDRAAGGPTAPPDGLYLIEVGYD